MRDAVDQALAQAQLDVARAAVAFPQPAQGVQAAIEARVSACNALLADFEGCAAHAAAKAGVEALLCDFKAEAGKRAEEEETALEQASPADTVPALGLADGDDEHMGDAEWSTADQDEASGAQRLQQLLSQAKAMQESAAGDGEAKAEQEGKAVALLGDLANAIAEQQFRKVRRRGKAPRTGPFNP